MYKFAEVIQSRNGLSIAHRALKGWRILAYNADPSHFTGSRPRPETSDATGHSRTLKPLPRANQSPRQRAPTSKVSYFRCLRAAGVIGASDGLDRVGAGIHAAILAPFQRLQYFDLPVSSREPAAPVLQAGALLRPLHAQRGPTRHRSRFCPSKRSTRSINPIHVSPFPLFLLFFPNRFCDAGRCGVIRELSVSQAKVRNGPKADFSDFLRQIKGNRARLQFPHWQLILGVSEGGPREECSLRFLFEDYALDTDRRELQRATDVIVVTPKCSICLNT